MQQHSIISPNGPFSYLINYDSSSSSPSSSSNYSTSPFGSEMGLPETEDDEFLVLAELTRRMAEFTFEDDGDDYEATGGYGGYNPSSSVYGYNHAFISPSKLPPSPSTPHSDPPQNPSHIFSLQNKRTSNKPQGREEGSESGAGGGRGIKTAEQQERRRVNSSNMQDRKAWKSSSTGRMNGSLIIPDGQPLPGCGSGNRVVFSVGSKINSVSNGTGVFLPSPTYSKAADPPKKPGCSTVIIPARVLQTLQQHFNNVGAKSQFQNNGEVLLLSAPTAMENPCPNPTGLAQSTVTKN